MREKKATHREEEETVGLEQEIRQLLEDTRANAKHYDSAQYDRRSGLSMRLEAIEEALVRIAGALDRRPD